MQEKEKSKIKVVIVILSVLLVVSLLFLAGILIHNYFVESQPTSVTVPDNIVTPEKDKELSSQTGESGNIILNENSDNSANEKPTASQSASNPSGAEITAVAISLYNRNPDDNTPFKVENMFPGDSETKYYCVRVSHKGNVILRFHADIRPGYEKLAEVLKCCVVLPENGEVLYDGLMRDMPDSLNHALQTNTATASETYYEITTYLDTSVGNEYMDRNLIADFRWWVEETGELDVPQTGDYFNIYLWLCLASGSMFLLVLLWRKRKKEDVANER